MRDAPNNAYYQSMSFAHAAFFWWGAGAAFLLFACWWFGFFWPRRKAGYFFFDPQDNEEGQQGRVERTRRLPKSASSATFEPLLKHYITVTQLVFTVAAAAIAFGANASPNEPIIIAKLALAWSIAFGVLFCALLIYRYDEYGQNLESYTPGWYATVFAAGFSCLTCFMLGFLIWTYGLSIA